MSGIENLHINRHMKEYFMKLNFYSEIIKSSSMLNNLEITNKDEDITRVVYNKPKIDVSFEAKEGKLTQRPKPKQIKQKDLRLINQRPCKKHESKLNSTEMNYHLNQHPIENISLSYTARITNTTEDSISNQQKSEIQILIDQLPNKQEQVFFRDIYEEIACLKAFNKDFQDENKTHRRNEKDSQNKTKTFKKDLRNMMKPAKNI